MSYSSIAYRLLSLLIAFTYFAFRVELFEKESEYFHPPHEGGSAFTCSSLNWETFDKDNAPKAFVFDPDNRIELISFNAVPLEQQLSSPPIFQLIRDKSPPVL